MNQPAKTTTHYKQCPTCGGEGSYETQHPRWGSRDCPEPYISVQCEDCEGEGEVISECEYCGKSFPEDKLHKLPRPELEKYHGHEVFDLLCEDCDEE